jgi:hypothetical protein
MNDQSRYSSLLDDEGLSPAVALVPKRERWDRRLDAAIRARIASIWSRKRARRGAIAAIAALLIGSGIGAYVLTRPVPQPDFTTANIDVLFNYALLTEEFNKLPIEQRIELLTQLVARLRSLDGDQSLLMAMFAAQLTGAVRDQFERNASLLAVDLFDSYATDLDMSADPRDRAMFVEDKFIEFTKTMEKIAGEERDISDEDRLIEARRQAKRDLDFMKSGRMPVESTARMASFLNRGVGNEATGHQKVRINAFIGEMVKTLREGEVPPEPERPNRRRNQPEQPPADEPDGSEESSGPDGP